MEKLTIITIYSMKYCSRTAFTGPRVPQKKAGYPSLFRASSAEVALIPGAKLAAVTLMCAAGGPFIA
ncbi:hypothetical protein MATL_G00041390 [Megalops atlanticus]|uniref:Uncharacterized protein n=1 Tax=Megalops atlanticus TaxID=7932 RepID=A0A9D3QEC0_MEGAT|nr:hypothetical protein MATL_G00041390 [Megalops atlanticus]